MVTKATDVTLTGTLTDTQGNGLAGTITLTLSGFGGTSPVISGTQLVPGIVTTAAVTNGTFSVNFYSNQIISPGPLVTFYSLSFVASGNTNQVFNFAQNYQFSPGTFDLSQLTPLTAVIANTSLPNTVTPHTFTAVNSQFLTGFTPSGNFTSQVGSSVVATVNLSAQQANISNAALYTVPANSSGLYRVISWIVVTQAGSVSSTMPAVTFSFNCADTSGNLNGNSLSSSSNGNTVTLTSAPGSAVFNPSTTTNITYSTSAYASSGATPMQYALHFRLEYLGS